MNLAVCLAMALLFICRPSEAVSATDCQSYGFNSNTLVCSVCEHVGQILGEQSEAKKKCSECCLNIATTEEKYSKAVLEVDKRALPYLPDIEAIIKKKKDLKLTVRYRLGSPQLLMFKNKEDYDPTETISVHSWNQDTFKDYLETHIKR